MTGAAGLLQDEVSRAARESGTSDGVAAMRLMTVAVRSMAADIPEDLASYLDEAEARWLADPRDLESLTPARVSCSRYLKEKNGNSTTIADRVDIALRALICVLWDDPIDRGDLSDSLAFFAEMVDRYGDVG